MKKILFWVALLSGQLLSAQQKVKFERLPTGISQKSVTTITQDAYGFMWFGTRFGLNKFNGVSYEVLEDDTGRAFAESSYIRDLKVDSKGDIWIATEGAGISKYIYLEDRFITYKHEEDNPQSLSSNNINAIFLDDNRYIWVATASRGLNRLDVINGTVERFWSNVDDPNSLSNNDVTDIEGDHQGNLWIGTWNGINLYDKTGSRFINYTVKNQPELISDKVRKFLKTKQTMWVGCQRGIYTITYDEGKYQFKKIVTDNVEAKRKLYQFPVMSIQEDKQGRIWIGTENGGLFIYDPGSKSLEELPLVDPDGAIISNSIWSMYADELGVMWIGTFNGGVVKVDPFHHRFQHIHNKANQPTEISHNMVSSFESDQPGKLWVATDGGGLNYFDLQTNTVEQFYDMSGFGGSNAIVDLLVDRNNDLWIAAWEGGITKRSFKTGKFEVYKVNSDEPKNGPCGNDIFDIMEDHRGNVWIGAFRDGVSVFDRKNNRFIHLPVEEETRLSIPGRRIISLQEDSKQNIWIGTQGHGVFKLRVNDEYQITQLKTYELIEEDNTSLGHNIALFVFEDSKGNIWLGTEGGGLNLYDESKDSFTRFTTKDGLPSNLIYSMQEDSSGKLWLSTNNGLCKFDSETMTVQIFDEADGIQSSEFITRSSYRNKAGELFFGGVNGFNRFYPEVLVQNEHIPRVYVTKFNLHGKELVHEFGALQQTKKITLDHDENDFSLEYAVLNYAQSQKNKYAYMLEGYDEDWIFTDQYLPVSYTNVPPGRYTFNIKGSNNNDIWNQQGASITIFIKKPWWATYAAFACYGALVIFGLIWVYRGIVKRERLKKNLEIEHLELNKLMELDEMKSRFFANISHEFRTPLTLILGPLKSLINGTYKGEPKSQYRIMQRNAERLLRLINQLLDLSKLESGNMKLQASQQDAVRFLKPIAHAFTSYAEKQYIDYKCEFPAHDIPMYFEKDKLEKIVVNLLSNAFKYTAEFGKVNFKVAATESHLVLEIEDTGVGIADDQLELIFNRFYQITDDKKQKGTGIGLALTKELVELHKGNIEVESQLGKGTCFTVKLPLGDNHLAEDEKTYGSEEKNLVDGAISIGMNPTSLLNAQEEIGVPKEEDDDLPIILIAEDNEDMRTFISEHLVTNYKILEAKDGREALSLAREHIPDVIVSDIMMPELNGYELCEKIKNDSKTCHIPIILLTAKASNESAEKGFEIGADYYVTKPFNPKLLELRIKNILKTREGLKSQLFNQETIDLEPKEVKLASKDQEFLKKLMAFIEDNIDNSELNVDHICKEIGLSRTQLYRKLKGLVGQSANEFIRSLRLKRAAQLLKQNEMTIAEVTYQVGFNDLQYFRFCFKKQFGVNPSEYGQEKI